MPRVIRITDCPICCKTFAGRSLCCSRSCSASYSAVQRGCPPWQPEELALLEKHAGFKSLGSITRAVQRLDQKRGWPVRSRSAVKNKMGLLGLSLRPELDSLASARIAQILGADRKTVLRWIHAEGLPAKRLNCRRFSISLKRFRVWARSHSDLLAGLNRAGLEWLLEDPVLAQALATRPRPHCPGSITLVRRDSGQTFRTFAAAARSAYLDQSAFKHHIAKGRSRFIAGGVEWEVICG